MPIDIYGDLFWEGTFEYDLENKGHHWKYAWWTNPTAGAPLGWGKLPEAAGRVFPHIKTVNTILESSFADKKPTAEAWDVVLWLKDPRAPGVKIPTANSSLTPILNAVVKDATFHSFEVLSSFVEDNVTMEIKGLRNGLPNWFYLHGEGASAMAAVGEFMLAKPNVFLDKNNDLKSSELKGAFDLFRFLRVLHKYRIVGFEREDEKIRIRVKDDVKVVDYPRGRICGCIPIPGKGPKETRGEPAGVNAPEVVVSPVVAKALDELSRIWQDPFAKSVLISAPPGSGKEVFATSIPYGNNRSTENLQTLSLATDDQLGLLRQLYGREREDGSIEEGLIAIAAGSALFLDEVHQPETTKGSTVRASLLRPLESDEFFPVESNKRQEVKEVLFVMATSKKLEDLSQFTPADFWTRMTHALAIKHPMDFTPSDGGTTLAEVLANFFNCFWWERIEKRYRMIPVFGPGNVQAAQINPIDYWQVHSMSEILGVNSGKPKAFAETFIGELNTQSMQPADFSVRGIRNMVTRLFSIAAASVSQGEQPWSCDAKFLTDVKDVFAEIQKVARLK